MKIVSWNVNGLRSVYKKGFLSWLSESRADIVCLQETRTPRLESRGLFQTVRSPVPSRLGGTGTGVKSTVPQLPEDLINPSGYYSFFKPAEKPGYSGIAIYSKKKPMGIKEELGLERFDNEGRFLRLDYDGFTLINCYLPHGGRKKENLKYKLEVYERLLGYLKAIKNENMRTLGAESPEFPRQRSETPYRKPQLAIHPHLDEAGLSGTGVILTGDFNVAHTEDDLARPKENKNNIMFTPEEREKLDRLTGLGFTDSFRKFHHDNGFYTWWPYFVNARERNLGWRLDYVFVSESFAPKLKSAFILTGVSGSDHCPAGIEI
ncbi:MAG: exodeoxyribonuclease III [bacterium]|nr:exodeoxyribonuclease III [bacterium]